MFRNLLRTLALTLAALLTLVPALAESAPAVQSIPSLNDPAGIAVETKVYPYCFTYGDLDEADQSEMKLSFIDGKDIPYLALSDFAEYLTKLYQEIGFGNVTYQVARENGCYYMQRPDNGAEMEVNPDENTITFLDYDVFVQHEGQKAMVTIYAMPDDEPVIDPEQLMEMFTALSQTGLSTEEAIALSEEALTGDSDSDEEDDSVSLFKTGAGYLNRYGKELCCNMNEYGIKLYEASGECYVPLQTMVDLLVSPYYFHWVFNGTSVIGAPHDNPFINAMYYQAPTGQMSEDFALFNYRELCFMLDHFYGLKPEHNITSFAELLEDYTGLAVDLASTDPVKADNALIKLLEKYFDDGHSGYSQRSYLSGELDEKAVGFLTYLNMGPSSRNSTFAGSRFHDARKAVYGDSVPAYEEVGNTAFVTFDEFNVLRDEEDYYQNPAEKLEDVKDTFDLIHYANAQVHREDSPVENIVVDLSNNLGGASNAAIMTICWLLDDAQVAVRNTMTDAETSMIFFTDVNFDGVINDEDSVSNYNLFLLTSINSFSCGNLVPAACKASNQVTLLGQTSGGGSCVVLPASTAAGSIFQISGPRQLAIMKNGTFYNIDSGIEPDVVLTKPETFYNRSTLVEKINALD